MAEPRIVPPPSKRAWTPAQSANTPADQRAIAPGVRALRFTIAAFSDNELVLFDKAAQESWRCYQPRAVGERF